ncbi:MAG: RNA-protein complex protein Nop10 [Methanomethylophilus sp.]
MASRLRRCPKCGRYTLSGTCPACGAASVCAVPPRFSPEDRYGKYRREGLREEMGIGDGQHR